MTNNEDTEPVIQDEQIQMILRSAVQTLAYIPIEVMRSYVKRCELTESRRDSVGPMLDPTGWMNDRRSGQAEDNQFQLQIAQHLLAAYETGVRREAFVQNLKVPRSVADLPPEIRQTREDSDPGT